MLTTEDIKNLSTLARIAVSDEEVQGLATDLDAVLAYVSEVSTVATGAGDMSTFSDLKNVMREDVDAYTGGEYRDAILGNAPKTEDGYVKVPKII